MPRKNTPPIPKSRQPKPDPRRNQKKKPCSFCAHGTTFIDYKDIKSLGKYLSDRGKIRGRRVSGNCQQHQRDITEAIKTARELALLPYTQRTVTERRTRGGGRDRDDRGPRDRDDRGPRTPRGESDESATSIESTEVESDATEEMTEVGAE
jgi:small subunit ribosomal protein S18